MRFAVKRKWAKAVESTKESPFSFNGHYHAGDGRHPSSKRNKEDR